MRTALIAGFFILLCAWIVIRFILPIAFLYFGPADGVDYPLPPSLGRNLPVGIRIWANILAGPALLVLVIAVAWYLLRRP